MFQSSSTSWSSKIMAEGTVERSHLDDGVLPCIPVQAGVLLEVSDLLARGLARIAPRADELAGARGDLVGVDLVPEE